MRQKNKGQMTLTLIKAGYGHFHCKFIDNVKVKNILVESGGNGRFCHETPKVILRILMRLKYTAFPH